MIITDFGVAVLDDDRWISAWVQQNRRLDHDLSLLPVLRGYIRPGDVVVDGGAFIGDHTIAYMDAVGPAGEVWAFEPNRSAFECLKYNCRGALLFPFALGDSYGFSHFIPNDQNPGASHLKYNGYGSVLTVALDHFNLPRCNFIKLDLEGFEVRAIRGAAKTITRLKPVVCVEVNASALAREGESPESLLAEMGRLDYEYKKVYETDHWGMPQFDALFLPV